MGRACDQAVPDLIQIRNMSGLYSDLLISLGETFRQILSLGSRSVRLRYSWHLVPSPCYKGGETLLYYCNEHMESGFDHFCIPRQSYQLPLPESSFQSLADSKEYRVSQRPCGHRRSLKARSSCRMYAFYQKSG